MWPYGSRRGIDWDCNDSHLAQILTPSDSRPLPPRHRSVAFSRLANEASISLKLRQGARACVRSVDDLSSSSSTQHGQFFKMPVECEATVLFSNKANTTRIIVLRRAWSTSDSRSTSLAVPSLAEMWMCGCMCVCVNLIQLDSQHTIESYVSLSLDSRGSALIHSHKAVRRDSLHYTAFRSILRFRLSFVTVTLTFSFATLSSTTWIRIGQTTRLC